jgi:hypothetical protein
MISYLVDVYELVLRAYHFNLERMTTDIESYVVSHVEQEDVKGKLQNLVNNLNNLKYDLLPQMEDYIEMKDFGGFVLTASFHNIFEEKTKSISSQGARAMDNDESPCLNCKDLIPDLLALFNYDHFKPDTFLLKELFLIK